MSSSKDSFPISKPRSIFLLIFLFGISLFSIKLYLENRPSERVYVRNEKNLLQKEDEKKVEVIIPTLDKEAYDMKMLSLANLPSPKVATTSVSATGTLATSTVTKVTATTSRPWPVKAPYPNYGAILPFNRIVAYYGNFYSKQMGVLGEYPKDVVLSKLQTEVNMWTQGDTTTPVLPAIHYIAAVAQASAGDDGDYLARMPFSEIDKAVSLANEAHGILFLDLQIGHSTALKEAQAIEKYLMLPQVHLGIDPEFSMKNGKKPGTSIGTLDASDINEVAELLAKIVRDNHLPPKILLVHQFTDDMVTNYKNIRPLPEVQIVMDMDGWGSPELKKGTYSRVITGKPVQFSGLKLFYKNDLRKPSTRMLTIPEILKLQPKPSYIQYQ
jgi:hypothetical protein